MPHRKITCVLFDLDGTLIDSRADLTSAVNAGLKAIGRPPQLMEEIVPHVGNGLNELLTQVMGGPDPRLDTAIDAFSEYYDEHCVDETSLYGGVKETLEALTKKARLGVVTNKPERFARRIVEELGVGDLLPVVVGGDTLDERKPHPAPIQKAVKDLKADFAGTLMVGDGSPDFLSGQAAGTMTCAALYGYGFREEFLKLKPTFCINQFIELKEIVK